MQSLLESVRILNSSGQVSLAARQEAAAKKQETGAAVRKTGKQPAKPKTKAKAKAKARQAAAAENLQAAEAAEHEEQRPTAAPRQPPAGCVEGGPGHEPFKQFDGWKDLVIWLCLGFLMKWFR